MFERVLLDHIDFFYFLSMNLKLQVHDSMPERVEKSLITIYICAHGQGAPRELGNEGGEDGGRDCNYGACHHKSNVYNPMQYFDVKMSKMEIGFIHQSSFFSSFKLRKFNNSTSTLILAPCRIFFPLIQIQTQHLAKIQIQHLQEILLLSLLSLFPR